MGWLEETHRQAKPVRAVAYDARKQARDSTKSFATERQARDWITYREEQIANLYREAGGHYRHRPARKAPTLAEYARSRVELIPEWRTKGTRKQRRDVIETEIRLYFGEQVRVDEVTKTDMRGMLAAARSRALAKGHGGSGASGQGDKLATFRKIFIYAVDEGLRPDDPTRGILSPPVGKKAPRPLSEDEISAIAAEMPEWLRAAVWVSADAGLRISEVCGLQRNQIDWADGKLWVKHVIDVDSTLRDFPKGVDVLSAPMTDRLSAELKHHCEHHDNPQSEYVFTLPSGKRLLPSGIRRRFYSAYARTGNPKRCPVWHDLRHNTAHKLKNAGAPSYVIQAVLRHKNLATSDRYLDPVSNVDQRQWVNRASDAR